MSQIAKTISREDYYKLVGLKALADDLNTQMRTIEQAAARIVGEEPEYDGPGGYGRSWEAICSEDGTVGQLLEKLGITVEDGSE